MSILNNKRRCVEKCMLEGVLLIFLLHWFYSANPAFMYMGLGPGNYP